MKIWLAVTALEECGNLSAKQSCESNKLTYRPITPKRSHFFEIKCAAVLAFCLIGKGHSGAKKVASILNIDKPINLHS